MGRHAVGKKRKRRRELFGQKINSLYFISIYPQSLLFFWRREGEKAQKKCRATRWDRNESLLNLSEVNILFSFPSLPLSGPPITKAGLCLGSLSALMKRCRWQRLSTQAHTHSPLSPPNKYWLFTREAGGKKKNETFIFPLPESSDILRDYAYYFKREIRPSKAAK